MQALQGDPRQGDPREQKIQAILSQLRLGQRAMAEWQGGELAVSAVPGAGKSTGIAAAVAVTIIRNQLNLRRFIVVVTFTRSAATNLKAKIRNVLQQVGLPPIGFMVYTLHGLALQIATRQPDRSGLSLETSTLISPRQNHRIIRTCVDQWIADNPKLYQTLIEGRQFDGEEAERLRRQSVLRTEILPELATTVIREAKSSGLLPNQLSRLGKKFSTADLFLRQSPSTESSVQAPEADPGDPGSYIEYPGLEIAAGLYDRYQAQLQYRQLIDYDDMLLAALNMLQLPDIRRFWQMQVFAVFEDEAQDSTPLQNQLLEILAKDPDNPEATPNLIRVGDPNQAINSTFTPADPTFFRNFCQGCEHRGRLVTMDRAGRSTRIIMDVANRMLKWTNNQFQVAPVLDSLPFRFQQIAPVPADDPQVNANPEPAGGGVEIARPQDIEETVQLIRQRVMKLVQGDRHLQAAVLVRENRQGEFLAQRLNDLEITAGIQVYEVGQQERYSQVPEEIFKLLQFIQRPHSPDYLKSALRVLSDRKRIAVPDVNRLTTLPEEFLYPAAWSPPQSEAIRQARQLCCQLLQARIHLPLTDLIAFLGLSLNYDQTELATVDKLTEQAIQRILTERSFDTLVVSVGEIINTERFEPVDTHNPESRYTQPGQLTIITMHKAKGLDWDYVFIPFLHEQTTPGVPWFPIQGQFLGDFTLSAVVRAQIRSYFHAQTSSAQPLNLQAELSSSGLISDMKLAWQKANTAQQQEEYRLLYVAMTRAKRLLWLSAARLAPFNWNKPENLTDKTPCPAIPMLEAFIKDEAD